MNGQRNIGLSFIVAKHTEATIFSLNKVREKIMIYAGTYDVVDMTPGCKDEITTTIKISKDIQYQIITKTHYGLTPIGKSKYNLDGFYNLVHDHCFRFTMPWLKSHERALNNAGQQKIYVSEHKQNNDFNMEITDR